jgi:DNA-binding NarL/FixJ family response regulator
MNTTSNLNAINNVKLILVDDNIPFRKALKKLLEIQYGCKIVAEASNGQEFLELTNLSFADIIIMDLMMPKMDGYSAAKEIIWQYPNLKIIAVTMHYDKAYLLDLITKGFKGCIFKSDLYEKIYDAIISIQKGGFFFPKELLIEK